MTPAQALGASVLRLSHEEAVVCHCAVRVGSSSRHRLCLRTQGPRREVRELRNVEDRRVWDRPCPCLPHTPLPRLALVIVCTWPTSSGGTGGRGWSWCVRWRIAPLLASVYAQRETLKSASICKGGVGDEEVVEMVQRVAALLVHLQCIDLTLEISAEHWSTANTSSHSTPPRRNQLVAAATDAFVGLIRSFILSWGYHSRKRGLQGWGEDVRSLFDARKRW